MVVVTERPRAILRASPGENGSEQGQAYIELVMVLPLLLITVAALIFFGRVLYAKIALDMTAYDSCRAAAEALVQSDGINQGMTAGRETLDGFYMDPTGAGLAIVPQGAWTYGTWIQCRASFNLFVGDIPGLAFFTGSNVSLHSDTWSRIETWRSFWGR